MNYLQYFVINLKGMVVDGWWCGDQEFPEPSEGMVNKGNSKGASHRMFGLYL